MFAPTQYKTFRRTSSHVHLEPEVNHYLSVNRTVQAPEYTLQLESAVKNGRIELRKDGVLQNLIEVFPSSLGSGGQVLHTTEDGQVYWSQDQVGTGGGGSSNDGVVASADFLSDTGKLRLITSGGTVITSPQSWDDRYVTIETHNSLLASVVSLQVQVAAMSFSLSSVQASLPKVRRSGVDTPLRLISFDTGSMATMYGPIDDHVHVWAAATSVPLDPAPV